MSGDTSVNDELKRRIQERLDALGISPISAATSVGLERSYIRDFLLDKKTTLTVDKLPLLAMALETSIEYLIQGIGSAASHVSVPGGERAARPRPRKAVTPDKPTLAFASVGDDRASIHVEATVPWDVAMTIVDLVKKSQAPA